MRIDFLTIFPQMFPPVLGASILGRAAESGILEFFVHDIREYSSSKHKNTDDYPFGGGAGMVMLPQPVFDCLDAVEAMAQAGGKRIYLSPKGQPLTNELAISLAREQRLILLCGHYEGIDERILARMDMQISIGDYVLTGGELPALVLADCISRFIPGVLGSSDSSSDESFANGLLEYPQYTRPASFRGMDVPQVLLSGHHANIQKWRSEQSLLLSAKHRPDLLKTAKLTKKDLDFLRENGFNEPF